LTARARAALVLLLATGALACGSAAPQASSPSAALAPLPLLSFIEDDWPRALAEAKKGGKPIFVDAWATWCHTCLSMREFVFPSPALRRMGKDFVWVSIDTEKPENAEFVRTHPMEAWPTLWVIDSASGSPALRWNGSATAEELSVLLTDAKTAIARGDGEGDASAFYLRGNKQTAAGDFDLAIASYRSALAAAPKDWPTRARAVEALSSRLAAKKDHAAVVELAAAELPLMKPGTSAKSVAYD
jgi:thiol-disulfide isomerase/thioredoxin